MEAIQTTPHTPAPNAFAPDLAQGPMGHVLQQVQRILVGQKPMLEGLLMGLLTPHGHILIEGPPGLAKTLAVSSLSQVVGLDFKRIQFTSDLMPMDLVGGMVFNPKNSEFVARPGPVFTNMLLADEINRAPAKVQSALLEAMAEEQVTLGSDSHKLPQPFLVLATQNPIEQEGTYNLPEAQLDRFFLKLLVTHPNKQEELGILNLQSAPLPCLEPKITKAELSTMRQQVSKVHLDESLKNYIVNIVLATRDLKAFGLLSLSSMVQFGASPRATVALMRAARASAFLRGRDFVTADDIKNCAHNVLRHRIILSFAAQAEQITTDHIVQEILKHLELS